jgi:hypothetical protein
MIVSEYDVCLSFAGEDRPYVERVASTLRDVGIRVFYDVYEQVDLWGKDLYQHLDQVYRHAASYCVIFISQHYAHKLWTRHELRSAQARAFTESREYILPARFDDTQLPGLPETVGYIDLRHFSPEAFAELISLKARASAPLLLAELLPDIPDISTSRTDIAPTVKRGNLVRANLIAPTRRRR